MELLLRILQILTNFIHYFVYNVLNILQPRSKNDKNIPPIRNVLLNLPLVEVIKGMRTQEIKSLDLIEAYIQRVEEIQPILNAVVQNRFAEARKEAQRADNMIDKAGYDKQLPALFSRYPLLGIPFTVKESCGLKGMSHVVGSLSRVGLKSNKDAAPVEALKASGAIPLLVSTTPEYCFSIETCSYTNGRTLNPYDIRRTCGASSGGEGVLNATAASLFGIGSDIAGSLRIPALYCGIFAHKPTGGLISNDGHFPNSSESLCKQYLQMGPMTRFGRDLGIIMQIMAGENAVKLDQANAPTTESLKIFYCFGFDGLNGYFRHAIDLEIKYAMNTALKYFDQNGLQIKVAEFKGFHNSLEIALSGISRLKQMDFIINSNNNAKVKEIFGELAKCMLGTSKYTKEGLVFELLRRTNSFMSLEKLEKYRIEGENLKREIIDLLGDDGVLFFPTLPLPAIHHHTAIFAQWNIDYCLLFNVLGLPSTHIPMGLDRNGYPVGFQVIAAPYRDKLCFQIASELDVAFCGWKPPNGNVV